MPVASYNVSLPVLAEVLAVMVSTVAQGVVDDVAI